MLHVQPRITALLLALAALLAACAEGEPTPPRAETPQGPEALLAAIAGEAEREDATASLLIDYPPEGAVFPPDFVPPTFLWHDETPGVDSYVVRAVFADGSTFEAWAETARPTVGESDPRTSGPTNEPPTLTPYQASAKAWTPRPDEWDAIQAGTRAAPTALHVLGIRREAPPYIVSRGRVTLTTSTDPVGAPIFYRDVPLMPGRSEETGVIRPLQANALPFIQWRLKDVTQPDSKVLLTDMPSCANCHSFSQDGKTLGMDVDGPQGDKGAYALAPLAPTTVIGKDEVLTWNDFEDKPEGHKTIGFLSRVSPDGRHVLTTLNEALYVANFTDYRFLQVFYPTRGILAWYDAETKEMKALPGADDPAYVHTNGVWSPDGEWIVFSRATARDPYDPERPLARYPNDPNETQIRYDLYRMPWRDGAGGVPERIEGASANGVSNTFPKVSPDGRWIVFTKCANGQLMRPDGRLWIVPFEGGEAREMRCNTALMNSWHTFSPNGRWMAFSSKVNSPYTQLFLTHVDAEGNDTPAILVPNTTAANRAVNLPEFVNAAYEDLDDIEVPAAEHHRHYWEGVDHFHAQRYQEAIPPLRRALEADPEFSRALATLAYALLETGAAAESQTLFERAITIAPRFSDAHNGLGLVHLRAGRLTEAQPLFEEALALNVQNGRAKHNLGLLAARQGDFETALRHVNAAQELEPDDAGILADRGVILDRLGRPSEALDSWRAALEIDPDFVRARKSMAYSLLHNGNEDGARIEYERAVTSAPDDAGARRGLARALLALDQDAAALVHLDRAASLAPTPTTIRLLAWVLATSRDDDLRNGMRAVALVEGLRARAPTEDPRTLDVLAAALAEVGRYEDAVELLKRARENAVPEHAKALTERLEAYESGRPWRRSVRAP